MGVVISSYVTRPIRCGSMMHSFLKGRNSVPRFNFSKGDHYPSGLKVNQRNFVFKPVYVRQHARQLGFLIPLQPLGPKCSATAYF